ncbi:MAG: nucleotidyltransferase family protein [Clostridia bacterium]|nr:nucleotidyltransferase family protein [Clostridia bacterium]
MEPIVGIICEYDPFHLGHRRQFELIRSQLPSARILCLMSGCFTQRGMPAMHSPASRAEAALDAGADMVMELPCAFAVRDAEHFALGGVEILTQLGFVTHISFGAEDDVQQLLPAAVLLENPTEPFTQALRKKLNQGLSFAAAQGYALSACLTTDASVWDRPNNILALCYLRALKRLNSPLIPFAVRREGDYHADQLSLNEWPSATAVRRAFREGRYEEAAASCGWELPRHPVCSPEALDVLLLHKLRSASAGELALLPDCSEGLENRLKSCASQAVTREELLELLKTKRYARARLSRLCTHAMLGITQEMLDTHPHPEYVRLLGFRRSTDELLSLLKQSALPVISKAADGDTASELYRLDLLAYELWALGAGIPSGMMFRQRIAIV